MDPKALKCVHGVNLFRYCPDCRRYNDDYRPSQKSVGLSLVFDEDPWKSNPKQGG